MDKLPGTFDIVVGAKIVTDLSAPLSAFDAPLALQIVRTHATKVKRVLFTPYVSTDGVTALRCDEAAVQVPFPTDGQPERFHHVAKALQALYGNDPDFKGQLARISKQDLHREVLRRKMARFIKGGGGAPFTLTGVFVFDRNCDLDLRMEVARFVIRSPEEHELAQMRTTVGVIYDIRGAEYEV